MLLLWNHWSPNKQNGLAIILCLHCHIITEMFERPQNHNRDGRMKTAVAVSRKGEKKSEVKPFADNWNPRPTRIAAEIANVSPRYTVNWCTKKDKLHTHLGVMFNRKKEGEGCSSFRYFIFLTFLIPHMDFWASYWLPELRANKNGHVLWRL